MDWDSEKIDNAVLGLLYLTLHDGNRAWKSLDWDAMSRLYAKGLIENPQNKNKSVAFTPEGLKAAQRAANDGLGKRRSDSWKALKAQPDIQYRPADGTEGVLCRSAVDNSYFFRIYQSDGTFEDYDLVHDELSARIDKEAMAALYKRGDRAFLDHNPEVLGLNEEREKK